MKMEGADTTAVDDHSSVTDYGPSIIIESWGKELNPKNPAGQSFAMSSTG